MPGVVGQAGLHADGAQKLVATPAPVAGHLGQEQANAELSADHQPMLADLYLVGVAERPEGGQGRDFDDDVVGFLMKYAEGDFKKRLEAKKKEVKIRYLDYDWSLNGS